MAATLRLLRNFPILTRKTHIHLYKQCALISDSKDYDLVVIGGGSGGLACAKEAATFRKKVAVLDFVDPSPRGTTWGLGGTCVNVGCIPKKLMHLAANYGHSIRDSRNFGWVVPDNPSHEWQVMCENVQNHVRSLNWGHRVQLKDNNVSYLNAKGFIIDNHTVKATTKNGKETMLKTKEIVVATGMRPLYPTDIPGAMKYAISSDDIFWMSNPPGKTLLVGASYVSLECAGFLAGLGFDTTVLIRSIPLRGFDQQMANLVINNMNSHGTKIFSTCVPTEIDKCSITGQLKVKWVNNNTGEIHDDKFDTVMMAIGRTPQTQNIGLENANVELDENGYIVGNCNNEAERSSSPNIYGIGDVLKDRPELTPVAIRAGKLLARRLFGGSTEQMDYNNIPTTVFTPLEYASVGLTEQQAYTKYGDEKIEVYHAFYKPIDYYISGRNSDDCYMKIIAMRESIQRVLGLHITGPNAGEIMQGFATAMKCGLSMNKLSSTIGIHPTSAEEVVKMHITKRSGLDPTVTGC